MVHYDHGMLGATLAVAVGAPRRLGWPAVVLAALAGMFPDWDAMSKHVSPRTYQIGHRVWGHNLFAVTLAGIALGGLGYLIHNSRPRLPAQELSPAATRLGPWVVLGVLILWTHPLLDVIYCGLEREADWPVGLLWPVVSGGYGVPWMPWHDWGATAILLGGLILIAVAGRYRQVSACLSLLVLGLYVAFRGALLHWG
jgi:hypothetical protein